MNPFTTHCRLLLLTKASNILAFPALNYAYEEIIRIDFQLEGQLWTKESFFPTFVLFRKTLLC